MSQFARVDPETLQVTLSYNTNGGTKWAEGDLACPFPFDVLADQAVRAEDGTLTLVEDPVKVQAKLEAQWAQLRADRNARLAASDWTQLLDSNISQDRKDQWAAYRQELRDLPDVMEDPMTPTWPLKPGEIPPTPVASSRFGALLEHAGEEAVPEVEPVPEAEPEAEPEVTAEVTGEPVPEAPAEVVAEPVAVPVAEPKPDAEPATEPEPEVTAESDTL